MTRRPHLYATLHASDCISCGEVAVRAFTPILTLARRLLAAGYDPETVLEVRWKDGGESLVPRSLNVYARWSISETDRGGIKLVPFVADLRFVKAPELTAEQPQRALQPSQVFHELSRIPKGTA